MRVQQNPEDIGRCGCGRRERCDGSHGLTEAQWQERLARERAAAQPGPGILDSGTSAQAAKPPRA